MTKSRFKSCTLSCSSWWVRWAVKWWVRWQVRFGYGWVMSALFSVRVSSKIRIFWTSLLAHQTFSISFYSIFYLFRVNTTQVKSTQNTKKYNNKVKIAVIAVVNLRLLHISRRKNKLIWKEMSLQMFIQLWPSTSQLHLTRLTRFNSDSVLWLRLRTITL